MFKVGDKVKVLDVRGIDLADNYFKNGDITKIVRLRSRNGIGLETSLIDGDNGLIILEDEYSSIEKIK